MKNELSGCPTKKRLFLNSDCMTAEEARKRAENMSKILIESELSEVYGLVYEASGNGQYEVIVYKKLSDKALERLKELGYLCEVFKSSPRTVDEEFEDIGYKISWKS